MKKKIKQTVWADTSTPGITTMSIELGDGQCVVDGISYPFKDGKLKTGPSYASFHFGIKRDHPRPVSKDTLRLMLLARTLR